MPIRSAAPSASRSAHHHGVAAFAVNVRTGRRSATIELAPAAAGRNAMLVHIVDDEERRVAPLDVSVEIAAPGLGIEPVRRTMSGTPGGGFSFTGPELSLPGPWRLRVEALITDFEKVAFETAVTIAPAAP